MLHMWLHPRRVQRFVMAKILQVKRMVFEMSLCSSLSRKVAEINESKP